MTANVSFLKIYMVTVASATDAVDIHTDVSVRAKNDRGTCQEKTSIFPGSQWPVRLGKATAHANTWYTQRE